MRATLLVLTLAFATAAGAAHAAPGTFMIVEGDLGYAMGEAFPEAPTGLATGITLGAGGKPKGWPLRFYGVLNLDWESLTSDVTSPGERSSLTRDTFAWSLGLRVIAPIRNRLRFFSEVTLGGYSVASTSTLGGGAEQLSSDDGSFLVRFAAGLQWRFNMWFSLGARIDLKVPTGLQSFDAIAEAAGASSSNAGISNVGFGLTATFHL
ncbi:MAG: hypothetical protein U1F43_14330 [Myxococcota bacterium]